MMAAASPPCCVMNRGFVKMQRGDATDELIRDKNATHLLTVIALRARFSDVPSLNGLTFGQALIGDYRQYDMTEKEYRGAKQRLERCGLVAFRSTNKGTIATLTDNRIFALKDDRDGHFEGGQKGELLGGHLSEVDSSEGAGTGADKMAGERRAQGEQRATNQNGKNGKKEISAPGAARQVHPLDDCFNSLCRIDGADPAQLTPSHGRRIAVALAELRRAMPAVTPQEIERRAERYRSKNPTWRLTAQALAKHWASLGPAVVAASPMAVTTEPPRWRERLESDFPGNSFNKDNRSWQRFAAEHPDLANRYIA